ncbi:MAG: HNH endonuclease signature motif containing protein, partial [bacterium]
YIKYQSEEVINQIRGKVIRKTSVYQRLPKVKEDTLDRAKGSCEVCGQPAPFITKEGKPYLEVHHIIALSDEGIDHTSNTVALCPNCHRKMHYGDLSLEEENKIILKLLEATKNM